MKIKTIYFAIISLFFIANNTIGQDTAGSAVTPSKFERIMKKKRTVLLDVRTPEEYESGYIGKATNFNVMDSLSFLQSISNLDRNKKYLLYCKSGRRSGKALVIMKNKGFKKIHHLRGGVTDWKGELNKPD